LTSGGVSWIEEFAALNGVSLLVDLLDTKLKIIPKKYAFNHILYYHVRIRMLIFLEELISTQQQ
jgi:hypothetical protein